MNFSLERLVSLARRLGFLEDQHINHSPAVVGQSAESELQSGTAASASNEVTLGEPTLSLSTSLPSKPETPICEASFHDRTSVVTMNTSIRETGTLELSLYSIFGNLWSGQLKNELTKYLTSAGLDDSYSQIFDGSNRFLELQLGSSDHLRKSIALLALTRLHVHHVETLETQFAYDPSTKPNPGAVYYPNPAYGKSLFEELPFVTNLNLLRPETPVCVVGDEIAGLIGRLSESKKFKCVEMEEPHGSVESTLFSCDNVAACRQLVDFAAGMGEFPKEIFKTTKDQKSVFVSPFYPDCCFDSSDDLAPQFERYRAVLRKTLTEAEVCFLSLATNQVWRMGPARLALPAWPSKELLPFCTAQDTTVAETVDELQSMFDCWRAINPSLKLVVGVSPIPLSATIKSSSEHVICSSALAKATLRVSIEEFARQNQDSVFYYPSLDAVTYATSKALENGLHISIEAEKKLSSLFELMFIKKT
jgi:hypothetical protein